MIKVDLDRFLVVAMVIMAGFLAYNSTGSVSFASKGYVNEAPQGYKEYSKNLHWIWNDIDSALAIAKKENKLVLLDFWAIWCVWCIKADRESFPHPAVEEVLLKYFVIVKIDVDRYPELQSRYGARALPTVVILDKNGERLGEIVGFRPGEEFASLLLSFVRG